MRWLQIPATALAQLGLPLLRLQLRHQAPT
jgi:hypothetical protein